jgi:hypothetical protein
MSARTINEFWSLRWNPRRILRLVVPILLIAAGIAVANKGPDWYRRHTLSSIARDICPVLMSGDSNKLRRLVRPFENAEEFATNIQSWGEVQSCEQRFPPFERESPPWFFSCTPRTEHVHISFSHPQPSWKGKNGAGIRFGYACRSPFEFSLDNEIEHEAFPRGFN